MIYGKLDDEKYLQDFTDTNDYIEFEDGKTIELDINKLYPEGWFTLSNLSDSTYECLDAIKDSDWVKDYKRNDRSSEFEDKVNYDIEEVMKDIINNSKKVGKTLLYDNDVLRYKDGSLIIVSEPSCYTEILFDKRIIRY